MTEAPQLTPEDAEFVAAFLDRLSAFAERKTDDCPDCGKKVTQLRKIGRCVYCYPCGCRFWQGDIPDAWRTKKP
jgi:hypothetical protein